jgi:hypothetical protein
MTREMSDPYDEAEEPYRRSTAVRTVALLLILAFGAAFAGTNLITALRQDDAITAEEALADPRGFKFLSLDPATHTPVRYNPCAPLPYVINPASAPSGGLNDVHQAIELTAAASGLEFVYEGETDEPVGGNRPPFLPDRYGRRWAPILIGWIPHDSRIFDVHDVGVAGSTIVRNGAGRLVYVSGSIVLNGAEQLANGFAPGKTWGKVVLHELGHLIGLDHVPDPAQVMHASLVSSPAVWGAGDEAGLRQLGALAGCLETPSLP